MFLILGGSTICPLGFPQCLQCRMKMLMHLCVLCGGDLLCITRIAPLCTGTLQWEVNDVYVSLMNDKKPSCCSPPFPLCRTSFPPYWKEWLLFLSQACAVCQLQSTDFDTDIWKYMFKKRIEG